MSLSRFLRVTSDVSPSAAAVRLLSHFHQHVPYSSYSSSAAATTSSYRNFTSPTNESANELYRRISPVGDHRVSIVPILDRWIEEGNSVEKHQLVSYIKELRHYGRNSHALEISMWMTDKRYFDLISRDAAIRLDLIAIVHGIKAAASYFETIPQQLKGINVYGSLLSCYCRVNYVEKAEAILQEMRDLGIDKTILNYNILLSLYHRIGDKKKFENVVKEIDDMGISYDVVTYNILISAFGASSDTDGMEMTLIKLESDPDVTPDWGTYTAVATSYRKAGLFDKAVKMLEKAEGLIRKKKKDVNAYYYIITSYAAMGKKDEVLGVWNRLKKMKNGGKVQNKGYLDVINSLSKLGDFENAEKIFSEWESKGLSYDPRIPNILVGAYAKVGRLEEAEAVVEKVRLKGVEPHANSWLSLAVGYLEHCKDALKAVDAMKRGVMGSKSGWKPDPRGLAECLKQLKEAGGDSSEEAQELMKLLYGSSSDQGNESKSFCYRRKITDSNGGYNPTTSVRNNGQLRGFGIISFSEAFDFDVSRNLTPDAYEENYEFADRVGSFKGLRRFMRNSSIL
ncbi:Pentatricopeptide repeat-containing protein At2g20710, mitochondrial [Linum perenne]